ncbi:MAG: WD40 repeat domain-containing protein [Myxococcales bacterium]|jgi:hypothetical protein|nr:WD40 repeat domain-containing protein [Myxococcales bacterium]
MKLELVEHVAVEAVSGLTIAGDRVVAARGGARTIVLDAKSGKTVVELPEGAGVLAVDSAGELAVVGEEGKTVGGRYEWATSLWNIGKGKKIATLAKNHPDDNIAPEVFGPTRLLAMRKRKSHCSFCLYDRAGEKVAEHELGDVLLPFRSVMSGDERLGAHAYFTGAAHLVDLTTGKSQKLAGGALRIGRQHDKGISSLAFDSTGEHLMYHSSGSATAHVWSVRTRKAVPGKWTEASSTDAFFLGKGALVLVQGRSQDATITVHALDGKTAARSIAVGERAMCFASLGDEHHVACAGATGFDPSAAKSVAVWNAATGRCAAKGVVPPPMKAVSVLAAARGRVALGDRKAGVALYAFG